MTFDTLKVIPTPEGIDRRSFLNVVSATYTAFVGNQGRVPTIPEIKQYCPHTEATIGKVVQTEEFKRAIHARGIPWETEYKGISPEQQRVITLITDPTDRRPLGKRLKSAGVSWATYQAWCKQPAFKKYVDNLAEQMLGENISIAHTQLIHRVQNGDLAAIKFFYEVTGRHNPAGQENINLRTVLAQVLEIIQRRVQDPETLQLIATDFAMLGGANNAVQNPLRELEHGEPHVPA